MKLFKKNGKLQHFIKFNMLLDRSFFIALLLICFIIFALCVSLYYSAKSNAGEAYSRRAQAVTLSMAHLLDSYFSRIKETQKEFLNRNTPVKINNELKNKIDILGEVMQLDHVRTVIVVSRDVKSLYSSSNNHDTESEFLQKHITSVGENKRQFISSPFELPSGTRAITVATPFFDKYSEYAGALYYVIDIDSVIKSFFKDIDFREYGNTWIFDQSYSMISNPESVLLNNKKISVDRRRFMAYALAKQNGSSSYFRMFPDGLEEKYIVCFSSIPLDRKTKWVICIETPAKVILHIAEGFPIIYSAPLLLFFFLIIILVIMKRHFGHRYIGILENVIVSSHDARKEVESRLTAIMESFPYIIFETDTDGRFTFLNVSPKQIRGIDESIMQKKNINELIDPSVSDSFYDAFSRLLKEGKPLHYMRAVIEQKDKNARIMSVDVSPIYDAEKNITGTRGVMHDITERVELEMNLIQSQKMDSIGMVTAGIAHDFNNYLSTMLGYITMMKMKDSKNKNLDALEQAAKSAAELTGQLMSFSRSEEKEDEGYCAELNKDLAMILDILQKSLPSRIALKLDVETDLPGVKISSAKINQILMNLVINARDAMPDGGNIRIKVWSADLNDIYSRQLEISSGRYVILEVEDTGKGLTEEMRNRVFEPYFTTKKTGTGLGLATVYAIVKNIGGNILIKSTPNKGTKFVIYIPQASTDRGKNDKKS